MVAPNININCNPLGFPEHAWLHWTKTRQIGWEYVAVMTSHA